MAYLVRLKGYYIYSYKHTDIQTFQKGKTVTKTETNIQTKNEPQTETQI